MSENRQSWDEYFIDVANIVGNRSTCIAQKVGAVIVKENRIIATGYNGLPSKFPHCNNNNYCIDGSSNCSLSKESLAIHAEVNAIAQAARHGVIIEGSTIYCTTEPCLNCLKSIVASRINRVVFKDAFKDNMLKNLLIERGFEYERFLRQTE